MICFLKKYGKTLLFFALAGLIGGFFTGLFVPETYPADLRQQLLEELHASGLSGLPVDLLLGVVTAFQAAGYGLILGAAGIWLGKKTGLWKDEANFSRIPLTVAFAVALVGGLAMILPDLLFFGPNSQAILDSYASKPSLAFILAGIIYGGVIEEVMLRLFMMSLFAFLLHKILGKGQEKPSAGILVISNLLSALLFAAGHLPATFLILGSSPLIIFRCFLLNGGIGVLFGWLYRKYGLRYAMVAHAGCHAVSKLIWLLFL